MPLLVLVMLAAIWGIFLVPTIRRARRDTERVDATAPEPDETVVVRWSVQQRRSPTAFVAATAGSAIAAVVSHDLFFAALAVGLGLVALRLARVVGSDVPVAIVDVSGVEIGGRGRLAWEQVRGLVRVAGAYEIVAAEGMAPAAMGRVNHAFRRLDGALVGYPIWCGLPTTGVEPEDAIRLLGAFWQRGVPLLPPRGGVVRRALRLLLRFLG